MTTTRQKTLVLNATYEPLAVVPVQRAVTLMVAEKATPVTTRTDVIRSAQLEMEAPSVVRLNYYVRVPYRRAPLSRRGVLSRDRYRCGYCGERATTVDHILPRSRGGINSWENLVSACRRCNAHKADRTPEEAGMRLRVRPVAPPPAIAGGIPAPEWEPYLAA